MTPLLTMAIVACATFAGAPPAHAWSCGWANLHAPGERLRGGVAQGRAPALDHTSPDQARVRADLETTLAPIAEWRQRTEATLCAAASTSAADTVLLAARLRLKTIVAELTVALESPEFQRLIWPDGAAGQAHRVAQRVARDAPAAESVNAETLVQFMKDRGVWPQRAEGDMYFYASEAALLEWFGPLVSDEIRRFLRLWADEQASPVAADASIQVPFDELERRIVTTERFLDDFPESPVRDPVRVRHQHYLALYLGGTDNTRAFDFGPGVLRAALRQRLDAFVSAHAGRRSAVIVADYLKLLRSERFMRTPAVTRFVDHVRGGPDDWRLLRY